MASLKFEIELPLDLSTKRRESSSDGGGSPSRRPSSSSSIEIIHLLTKDSGRRNPCLACGIGFSSTKTLEAHQNFYCAKKSANTENNPTLVAREVVITPPMSSLPGQFESKRQSVTTTSTFIPAVPDSVVVSTVPVPKTQKGKPRGRAFSSVSKMVEQSSSSPFVAEVPSLTVDSPKSGNFCSQCPFRANTIRGLRSHVTKCHFKDTNGKVKEPRPRIVHRSSVIVAPKRPKIDGVCSAVSGGLAEKKKYCKYCDISFKYLSTFLAHRKYYCTVRKSDVTKEGVTDGVAKDVV